MDNKDKIDLLHKTIDSIHKQSDIIYKKVLILLSVCAGITTIWIKIVFSEFEVSFYWLITLSLFFTLSALATFINYIRLSFLYKETSILKDKLKGLNNE